MTDEADVILIDMGSVFAMMWHATKDEPVSEARARSVDKIRALVNGHKRAAVCCDSRTNWRKELAPSYKEQREPKPASYFEEMARTEETLRKDGVLTWRAEGFEADDVIATAAAAALDRELSVLVHSSDKDLLQLVLDDRDASPGVVVCSVRDGRRYREADVLDKFGVRPAQMRDWLALVGDSSDNIKGVRGVGPKTAAELLTKFGTVEGFLAQMNGPRWEEVGGKAIRATLMLPETLQALALAQKLVTLRADAPIEFTDILEERPMQPLTEREPDDFDGAFDEADEPSAPKAKSEPPPPPAPPAPVAPAPEPARREPLTAMVVSRQELAPVPFDQGLQPPDLREAFKLSKALFDSRLYQRYGSSEAIFAVIIRGREMGLGALTALDSFHVIQGRPCPSAHLLAARAKAHPDCEYFYYVEGDEKSAVYETKNRRNPKPTRHRYTFAQAEAAGLVLKDSNWLKRSGEMVRKTCASQLARIEYPDVLLGLYAAEELEESA